MVSAKKEVTEITFYSLSDLNSTSCPYRVVRFVRSIHDYRLTGFSHSPWRQMSITSRCLMQKGRLGVWGEQRAGLCRVGFLPSALPIFGTRHFSALGDRTVYYRKVHGIPGLFLIDARKQHPHTDCVKCLQTLANVP